MVTSAHVRVAVLLQVLGLLLYGTARASLENFLCDDACSGSSASLCVQDVDNSKEEITLLGLFPCHTSYAGRPNSVAAQMAIRAVNNDSGILKDYNLRLKNENAMCASLPAVRAFIDDINPSTGNQSFPMIIGTGCTSGAKAVSPLSNSWNFSMVSFTASGPSLSDKSLFPNFLRVCSSDKATAAAVLKLVSHYGWKQLGVITKSNIELAVSVQEIFRTKTAMDEAVRPTFYEFSDSQSLDLTMQDVQSSGLRVFFVNMFESNTLQVICKAYQKRLLYPTYLWLTYGWLTEDWYTKYNETECTLQEITQTLHRSIAINHFSQVSPTAEQRPTDVKYTTAEFWQDYRAQVTELYPNDTAIFQGTLAYDAVWLAAYMIDSVFATLGTSRLADLSYTDRSLTELLLNASRDISFTGITGRVSVDENGDRTGNIRLEQYRYLSPGSSDLTLLRFAVVTDKNKIGFEPNESDSSVWPDGVLVDFEPNYIDAWLFGVMTALSIIGMIFAACCITFDIVLRNRQSVKLTSPLLNVFIVSGIVLLFVNVVVLGLDRGTTGVSLGAFCMVSVWLASISFTLIFGTLFAKTFRVYWIWSRSQRMSKAKPLKNWILLVFVALLVAVDVFVLVICTAVDSTRLGLVVKLIYREGTGLVPQEVEVCQGTYSNVWIGILIGYKGLLLLIGIFLSVQTWNIKLKQINDSHLIAVSILTVSMGSIVAVLMAYLLLEMVDVAYGLVAAISLLIGFFILALLYLPKMRYIIQHPSGEVFRTQEESTSTVIPAGRSDSDKIRRLKEEISQTKAKIAQIRNRNSGASARSAGASPDKKGSPGSDLHSDVQSNSSTGEGSAISNDHVLTNTIDFN